MTLDPTTASRLCMPIALWPKADQDLWTRACTPISLFEDEGGELANLAVISRAKYAKGWGRWICFLETNDPAALDLAPAQRCSKKRLQAYVEELRGSGNSDGTIINRLEELRAVAGAMDCAFDGKLINRYIAALRSKAKPVRSKAHIRPTNGLVDLGLLLMKSASDPGDIDQALTFRDGLIIAFLALHPVRRRNLASFSLGKNLIRLSSGYMVAFAANETKHGVAYEAPLADVLVEFMDQYLKIWRPALIARTGRWKRAVGDAVWVSSDGSPMSQEALSGCIEKRTRDALGKAINPHAFRDAAATTLVVADPARVRSAAPLLGHRSLATTEKHYIQAKGLEAQRSYLDVIAQVRQRSPEVSTHLLKRRRHERDL